MLTQPSKAPLPSGRKQAMPTPLVALRAAAQRLAREGVSIREWARRCGVPQSTLSHWIDPETRTADLNAICCALDVADVAIGIGDTGATSYSHVDPEWGSWFV